MPVIPKDIYKIQSIPYFLYFGHFGFVFLLMPTAYSSHLFSAIDRCYGCFSIANNIYRASLGGKLIVIQWWCEILMLINISKPKHNNLQQYDVDLLML